MPVIKTYSSTPISTSQRETLKAAFGQAISALPGKSETWLMCLFEENVPIYHGGSDSEPAAFVEASAYSPTEVPAGAWVKLTAEVTDAVAQTLGVDPARIYVQEASTPHFGWSGRNF